MAVPLLFTVTLNPMVVPGVYAGRIGRIMRPRLQPPVARLPGARCVKAKLPIWIPPIKLTGGGVVLVPYPKCTVILGINAHRTVSRPSDSRCYSDSRSL